MEIENSPRLREQQNQYEIDNHITTSSGIEREDDQSSTVQQQKTGNLESFLKFLIERSLVDNEND